MKSSTSERTYIVSPSNTSQTLVYTCPDNNTSGLSLCILTNSDTSIRNGLVEWYDASSTTTYKIFDKNVKAKDSVFFDSGGKVILEAGDKIYFTAAVANQLTCVLTVEERFDPIRN